MRTHFNLDEFVDHGYGLKIFAIQPFQAVNSDITISLSQNIHILRWQCIIIHIVVWYLRDKYLFTHCAIRLVHILFSSFNGNNNQQFNKPSFFVALKSNEFSSFVTFDCSSLNDYPNVISIDSIQLNGNLHSKKVNKCMNYLCKMYSV